MPASIQWPELIAGVVLCLMGWTCYWVGVRATGLALGAMVGAAVAVGVASMGEWLDSLLAFVAVGVVAGGFIGYLIVRRIHTLVFFLSGAVAGAVIARLSYATLATWPGLREASAASPLLTQLAFYLVCSALMGAVTAALSRYMVIVATAAIGSVLVAYGVGFTHSDIVIPAAFVLSLAAQLGLLRRYAPDQYARRQRRETEDEPDEPTKE
jgi:hypothetical protein